MVLPTKRERVLRTVRLAATDRVPIYDLLQNQPVIEHSAGEPLTVENGKRLMGIAIAGALDMTRSPGAGPYEPAVIRQENGPVIQRERWTSWIVEQPRRDIPGLIGWITGEARRSRRISSSPRIRSITIACLAGAVDPAVAAAAHGNRRNKAAMASHTASRRDVGDAGAAI